MDESQSTTIDSPVRTIEWLAEFLSVPVSSAYGIIRDQKLPRECVVKIGRRIRVDENNVRAWWSGQAKTAAS